MNTKDLTKAEMEIMKIIWDHEGMFLADIIAAIPEPRPAYTTVSTVVRVLVSKGFVCYKQYGKSNCYSAAVSKEEYSHRAIEQMQSNLFGGSYSAMLSFFAKKEDLSAEERQELLAMLSEDK
ncbi:MAG: BlaI/MecI/CopY family transcriptional regulator [Rikenellaceae bacterium]